MANTDKELIAHLARIADALERLTPADAEAPDLDAADAFTWHAEQDRLEPVTHVSRVPLDLLRGVDLQIDILRGNTERFAEGLPANNALLWGARGMGKSSLVKGGACGDQQGPGRRPGAGGDPSRGHLLPAPAAGRAA